MAEDLQRLKEAAAPGAKRPTPAEGTASDRVNLRDQGAVGPDGQPLRPAPEVTTSRSTRQLVRAIPTKPSFADRAAAAAAASAAPRPSAPPPTPSPDAPSAQQELTRRLSGDFKDFNEENATPQPTSLAGRAVQAAGEMATHPIETAKAIVTALPEAGAKLGMFAAQEQRKAMGDWIGPDQISRREAAFNAGQLLASGFAEAAMPFLDAVFGKGMQRGIMAAKAEGRSPTQALILGFGARTATHAAVGAGVGAAFSPDDPEMGALLGAAIGGVHAGISGETIKVPDVAPPEEQLSAGGDRPARATATARPGPAGGGPDYTVDSPAGNSAATVEADYLPSWDTKTMGEKPTRAEYEAFKKRAVDSMLDEHIMRAAKGEKVGGFGQSPREPIALDVAPEGVPRPPLRPEGAGLNTPEEITARDKPTGVAPPEPGPRKFPATAQTLVDLAKQKDIPVAEAAKRLADVGYEVPDAVIEKAKETVGDQHSYSSTQFNLPSEHAAAITELARQIPDEHLAENGRETTPHVTVKYGLHTDNPDQLHEILKDHPPVPVTFGKTSVFPNGESGSGDVVKVDVDSPELHALNQKIAGAMPVTDTHPEYKPHATVAYVKPGMGEQYAGNGALEGKTTTLDRLTFSSRNGKQVEIPLTGRPPASATAVHWPGHEATASAILKSAAPTATSGMDQNGPNDGVAKDLPATRSATLPSDRGRKTGSQLRATEPESIRAAAVRTPDGRVIEAPSHWQAVEVAQKQGINPSTLEDIFVTNTGRRVSRVEAESIDAKLAGAEPTGEPLHTQRASAPTAAPISVAALERESAAMFDRAEAERRKQVASGDRHPDETDTSDDGLGVCTNCAQGIVDKFGGVVVGYHVSDNPTAKLGQVEEGHDFAIVGNGRYIVDPWAQHTVGETKKSTLDLAKPEDRKEAISLYGDPSTWSSTTGGAPGRAALQSVQDHLNAEAAEEAPTPSKPPSAGSELPIPVDKSDIPYGTAYDAYRWNSMSPDRRAEREQQQYVDHIAAVYNNLRQFATTPETEQQLATELTRYKEGYVRRLTNLLNAASRTASPMVAGPANFNTRRNQKAIESERKKLTELVDWSKRAQSAMWKTLAPPGEGGPISADDPEAITALKKKVERLTALQEKAKTYNRLVQRGTNRDGLTTAATKLVAELAELGFERRTVKDLVDGDVMGNRGFPGYWLSNNNAKIKAAQARVDDLVKRRAGSTAEYPFDGGRVVENVEDNRVQLHYDAKPAPEMIQKLKSRGFKWAPSVGAWQRQLTNNALYAVTELLGLPDMFRRKGAAPAEAKATEPAPIEPTFEIPDAPMRIDAATAPYPETPITSSSEAGQTLTETPRRASYVDRAAASKSGPAKAPATTPAPPDELEYRNLGLSIPAEQLRSARTGLSQAVTDRNAPIIGEHPELARALSSAQAMSPHQAGTFVRQLGERATAGLTEQQKADFGTKILHDNLVAEAERKAAQADELEAEPFEPEAPKKSARGLWYSRTTEGGELRKPEEMETGPLVDELHRRADNQIKYDTDHRKYGPMSAVTRRNAARIAEIEQLLQNRDKLDPEDVWNEIGRRRAEARGDEGDAVDDGTDFHFGANAADGEPAKETPAASKSGLTFDLHEPPPPEHPAVSARAAAENFTRHAAAVGKTVKPGIEREPWFQKALKAHLETVQPFLDRAAALAGVNTESFRKPSLGAYMRLVPPDRLSEPLISRAQSIAANDGAGATAPRTGYARRILGQKGGVLASSPLGTEAPVQGPANVLREEGAASAGAQPGTKQSGSAKMATGSARAYSSDYLTNLVYDAADKVAKAAHNQIFTAIAQDAASGAGGVEELTPDKNAPPGKSVVAFNDSKELVDPPPADDEMSPTVRRFAVPKEVGAALDRYRERPTTSTAGGRALRNVAGAITKSVLMNPLVAGTHTLSLASSVGTGIPAGAGPVRTLATGLPGVKVGTTLARMKAIDFDDPEIAKRLMRLAFNGALRLGEDRQGGIMNAGHHFLFGPKGMDTRARLVASMDAEAGLAKAGITPGDPRFGGLERKYVVEHAGNYVGRNQGSVTKWLQDNGIAPFIAINRAKLGTSLKALVGSDGLVSASAADHLPLGPIWVPSSGGAGKGHWEQPPNRGPNWGGIGRRAGVAWRGPLGAAAAIAAAGYLLSGHTPDENAQGKEGDMALGVYHLPDGSFHYYRGDPKEAVTLFGKGTKEVYLRRGIIDPASETALRLLQPIVTAHQGDKIHDVLRAAVNTALGFVGPAAGAAFGLTTGRSLYMDQEGNFATVEEPELPGNKTSRIKNRVVAATRNANAAAALTLPAQGDQTSPALGRPLVNVLTEGSPTGRQASERFDVNSVLDDRVMKIYREPNRAKRQEMANAAVKEFADAGYRGAMIRRQLQQAVVKAGIANASQRKFDVRIRGGPPQPTARP